MDGYIQPTDSKRYMPLTPNHPRNCLQNIPFCLTRHTCTIFEEENTELKRLSDLKTLKHKYPIVLIESNTKRA